MLSNPTSRSELLDQARQAFTQTYGEAPRWCVFAPGRVNLIGDHTDYTGGLAMPFAIEPGTIISAAPCAPDAVAQWHISSSREGVADPIILDAQPIANSHDWSRYLRGVAQGFAAEGVPLVAMNLHVHSNLASGAGLSSSAALEVATGRVIELAADIPHDPDRMVRVCHAAEHAYAGVPCGHLDQFSITHALYNRVMLFDAHRLSGEQIDFDLTGTQLLIIDSNVSHALGNTEYPLRRQQCEAAATALGEPLRDTDLARVEQGLADNPVLLKRARHVVTENQRVRQMATALANDDPVAAGELMFASHASLANDYEVSCEQIDLLLSLLTRLHSDTDRHCLVYGARMTGGGFGGAVIALIRTGGAADIIERIGQTYLDATGLTLDSHVVEPRQGVHFYPGQAGKPDPGPQA